MHLSTFIESSIVVVVTNEDDSPPPLEMLNLFEVESRLTLSLEVDMFCFDLLLLREINAFVKKLVIDHTPFMSHMY